SFDGLSGLWRSFGGALRGRRNRNVNEHLRVVRAAVCRAADCNGEREVFVARGRFDDRNGGKDWRSFDRLLERKFRLAVVRRVFPSSRAVRSHSAGQLPAPNGVSGLVWREITAELARGSGRRRTDGRKMRITKTADANSRRGYGATLKACCIHRWFCAADASTPAWSEPGSRIARERKSQRRKSSGE